VVYVILADRQRQHALAVIAAGGDVDLDEVMDGFDARLNEAESGSTISWEQRELMDNLGLRRR